MAGILSSLQGAVGQGVLWGIMVLGIYITFRLMDIADLTVDGSFALGGSVCAALVAGKGMNPVLALVVCLAAGMAAGAVTGILHTVFEIPAILAGILTQISLWSINLKVMGKSNMNLGKAETPISWLKQLRTDSESGHDCHRTCSNGPCDCISLLVLWNRAWKRHARHWKQRGHDPRSGRKYQPH